MSLLVCLAACRCGPARHSILLAQSAGSSGLAVDISQGMLDYAAKKAEAEGVADKLAFLQVGGPGCEVQYST